MKLLLFAIKTISIITLFTFLTTPTYAQTLSLSVSPPVVEIRMQPGRIATRTYTVKNLGERTSLIPLLMEYTPTGVRPLPALDTTAHWIQWNDPQIQWNTPFPLEAGTEKKVELHISPGTETAQQDYPRAILFQTVAVAGTQFSHATIQQSIGSILLINLTSTGAVAKSVQVASFTTPMVIDSFGPLSISIDVKNNGNTFTRVLGSISIGNGLGTAAHALAPHLLLPGETYRLISQTPQTSSYSYSNNPSLKLYGFFIGSYTVEYSLIMDNETTSIQQKKTVYAIPWKAFLALSIGWILYRTARRLRRQ